MSLSCVAVEMSQDNTVTSLDSPVYKAERSRICSNSLHSDGHGVGKSYSTFCHHKSPDRISGGFNTTKYNWVEGQGETGTNVNTQRDVTVA